MKPIVKLEKWSIKLDTDSDYYRAPETRAKYLSGLTEGHPRKEDGSEVLTSRLLDLNLETGFAETRNTVYQLGSPNPEWVEFLKQQGSATSFPYLENPPKTPTEKLPKG